MLSTKRSPARKVLGSCGFNTQAYADWTNQALHAAGDAEAVRAAGAEPVPIERTSDPLAAVKAALADLLFLVQDSPPPATVYLVTPTMYALASTPVTRTGATAHIQRFVTLHSVLKLGWSRSTVRSHNAYCSRALVSQRWLLGVCRADWGHALDRLGKLGYRVVVAKQPNSRPKVLHSPAPSAAAQQPKVRGAMRCRWHLSTFQHRDSSLSTL